MSKTMYDSVNYMVIPTDAEMVAGYVTGDFKWPATAWGRWPREREVHIDVTGTYPQDSDVLDIENGAATIAQAVPWIVQRVKHGRACLYFSRSNLGKVAAAVINLPAVDCWVADWTGEPHTVGLPGNMHLVAVQYENDAAKDYDLSVVYDPTWPWGEK